MGSTIPTQPILVSNKVCIHSKLLRMAAAPLPRRRLAASSASTRPSPWTKKRPRSRQARPGAFHQRNEHRWSGSWAAGQVSSQWAKQMRLTPRRCGMVAITIPPFMLITGGWCKWQVNPCELGGSTTAFRTPVKTTYIPNGSEWALGQVANYQRGDGFIPDQKMCFSCAGILTQT